MSRTENYPPIPTELKPLYPMTCTGCGYEQSVAPSMMMRGFALNTGHGRCLSCDQLLHLWIDGDIIKSELFSDYAKRIREATDGTN